MRGAGTVKAEDSGCGDIGCLAAEVFKTLFETLR
jgi:hypothetical protein